ncbi:977_t:CDS:10 [Paraglomus occultum]|uniref:977_t:CDS:1 n=1 Tax=Paraglomus occultum TaxID=144539 RepID=A0A9N9B313_9GLOM|nr:977_t:CDS:10 [Paraglomus occultum]
MTLLTVIVSPYAPEVFLLSAVFLLTIYWIHRRPKLNEPPLVPCEYPLIRHSFEFLQNSHKFVKQCHEQYGDIFSFYSYRQVYTVVSNSLAYELFRTSDFSSRDGFEEKFLLGYLTGSNLYPDYVGGLANLIKGDRFVRHIENCQSRSYRELRCGIDQVFGDCEETKVINDPEKSLRYILSRAAANIFVGEELCKDDEIVETFATFAAVLVQARSLSQLTLAIHPRLYREYYRLALNYGGNPVQKHKDLLIKKLKPVFEKRYRAMQQFGDKWKPPDDLIQQLVDYSLETFGKLHYDSIACRLLILIFASIHTTTGAVTGVLNEFAARPEYWRELREEQEAIAGDADSDLTMDQINKMEKLDSFVKESFRLKGSVLFVPHRTMSKSYTFSNGYQIPEGRLVYMNFIPYEHDPSLHGDEPEKFSAFRHVNKSPFTKVGRNSMTFGLGKHACPGRWFASRHIKMILSILIRKYDVSIVDEKLPKYLVIRGINVAASIPLAFKERNNGPPPKSLIQIYVERACHPALYEPNLALDLEIADVINQKKQNYPREAAMHIVKMINHRNPNVAMLALTLLDICVKNCGYPFHMQIATKEFLNELVRKFPDKPPIFPNPIQMKILELIQAWKSTLCVTSRYKEDLLHISDMHRLLTYKGYRFPEVDTKSASVLNPAEVLKSPEELEEEDRAAQAAKLQELIRRGSPADLAEANELMKIMAGYDPDAKPDYKKQAFEELERIRRKTTLLNDMLDGVKEGEKIGDNDVFHELMTSCKGVQPKIQKLITEEEESDSIEKLLSLNDLINNVLKRYDNISNGIFTPVEQVEPAPDKAESANQAPLLIDFSSTGSAPSQNVQSTMSSSAVPDLVSSLNELTQPLSESMHSSQMWSSWGSMQPPAQSQQLWQKPTGVLQPQSTELHQTQQPVSSSSVDSWLLELENNPPRGAIQLPSSSSTSSNNNNNAQRTSNKANVIDDLLGL